MNNDLISRQAAIDKINEYASVWMEYTDSMSIHDVAQEALNAAKRTMVRIVSELPSVTPKQKTGKWTNHRNDGGHNIADCVQCGEAMQWFDDDIKPNFCPICGARMTEDET